jgi:sugar/nucleoside kinase (ribokinase family)
MSQVKHRFDLVAIGNALVDVLAQASDEFIAEEDRTYGMAKGGMTLIDAERAKSLYGRMGPATEMSGGSAANTMAGFASFGGKGAFIGKVGADQLGEIYRHDMTSLGVAHTTVPLTTVDIPTGRCLVLITPDAQRTMSTYLGASVELSPDDVDAEVVSAAKITYLEGYLFDRPQAKQAFHKASMIAHAAGNKVALTLSDSFCVDRHRDDFQRFVQNHVDILFANEAEIISLYQSADFEKAVAAIQGKCDVAVITRGAKGSVIVTKDEIIQVKAEAVSNIEDTTGAGDQFAAGFLYGYTHGYTLPECGRLGAMAAAEVIGHVGPRPLKPYADFLKEFPQPRSACA